jgi:hypothetical protein
MKQFFNNRYSLFLLLIGLVLIIVLSKQYSEFSFNPTVFYLSVGIFIFNLIVSLLTFSRIPFLGYFLLFGADLILVLNIFLILGLTK